MKFLHLGDLHLGKSLGDFNLIDDQEYILNEIMEMTERESIDAVLIAGDVYDRADPSEAAIRLLDSFVSQLASKGVKTFMISGNHDSDERLNYGRILFEKNQIYISSIFNGELSKYVVTKDGVEVNVYLLPFVKASQVRHFFPEENIENYEDAVRVILSHANVDTTKKNILVAHQFVAGRGEDPALGGSEGSAIQNVGLVEKIGYDLFDQFDYVALGHIHSPQKVGRDEVRYSGSPLKYSLSEVNNEKSVPIITVDQNEKVNIELIPLKAKRNMRHIKGKLIDLLNPSNVTDTEDFIYATLTDEDIINDAMGIFQQTFPNTVKIDYDNSHTRAIEQFDITNVVQDRPFAELVSDFYKMVYGCEITEEEMEVMRMVAREAGVADEAN